MPADSERYTYHFTGRVHPARATLSLPEFVMDVELEALSWRGEAKLAIYSNQVFVDLVGDTIVEDLLTLKNYALYIARALVDANAYHQGLGYDVEITALRYAEGYLVAGPSETRWIPASTAAEPSKPSGVTGSRTGSTSRQRGRRCGTHST